VLFKPRRYSRCPTCGSDNQLGWQFLLICVRVADDHTFDGRTCLIEEVLGELTLVSNDYSIETADSPSSDLFD
jgi:hypothetical protein